MKTKDFLVNFPWPTKLVVSSYKVAGPRPIQASTCMLAQLEKSSVKWKDNSNLNHLGIIPPASNVQGK